MMRMCARWFFFGAVLFFISCETDIEKINVVGSINNAPKEVAENIEVLYSDSGYVKMKLDAPVLEKYDDPKDPYVIFPKGMKTVFYDRTLTVTSRLDAEYGKRYVNSQRMEA